MGYSSIYTYFLFSLTYCSRYSRTICVTVVSCWIAIIFRSFIKSLGHLTDKCTFSVINSTSFFYICIIIFVAICI